MPFESQAVRGVTQHFGPRRTNGSYGGQVVTEGSIKEEVIRIRYNELPTGGSAKSPIIPANASVLSAQFKVKVAFTGGTSFTVGTYNASTGAAVVADGLMTAANLALANINAVGNLVTGSGTQVNTSVGTSAVRVGMAATGTFTAGYAEIVIRYLEAPPTPTA